MTAAENKVFFFLPGSGGGTPNLSVLNEGGAYPINFHPLEYPGWSEYVKSGFSPDDLISELSMNIESIAPVGPINIVGLSLGGHFAYLLALDLQKKGRRVDLVVAIDSFMVATAKPMPGWKRRATHEVALLILKGKIGGIVRFARSKMLRMFIRSLGDRLPAALNLISRINWASNMLSYDKVLRQELDIRMLARVVAPWLAAIDEHPVELSIPAMHLRTSDSSTSDVAWLRRCPKLQVYTVTGTHETLFDTENSAVLRKQFFAAISTGAASTI